jgi:DNA-binding NtrC family response regulator
MINFIARSLAATNALKALRLSAELPVNIIIVGENGVGKKTLIKTVFKEKEIVAYNGEKNFSYTGRILIENIQKYPFAQIKPFLEKRIVIATSTEKINFSLEKYFSVLINLSPLSERMEDVFVLIEIFKEEIEKNLGIKIDTKKIDFDLSQNGISLKRSMYKYAIINALEKDEILQSLKKEFEKNLTIGYKKLLKEFFEKPLFEVAQKKLKSVLQISKILKLNRATVTAKLNSLK